jgi:hypothetical protein
LYGTSSNSRFCIFPSQKLFSISIPIFFAVAVCILVEESRWLSHQQKSLKLIKW